MQSLKDYVVWHHSVHVVLAQEARTLGDDIADASKWFKRKGWRALISDASPGATPGNSSVGVAIIVRDWTVLGLSQPPLGTHDVPQGRLVAGILEAPGLKGIVVYSGCLCPTEGLSGRNLGILKAQGEHALAHGRP